MKGRIVALDTLGGRKAAALIVDGRLDDLLIDGPLDGTPRPGTVFAAIADRPMKGAGGAMVKLPGGLSGFLRDAKTLRPGQLMPVQVTGYAEAGKAVPVSAKLLFKGRWAIATPGAPGINVSRQIRDEAERARLTDLVRAACPDDIGLILRSAAEGAEAADVREDATRQIALAASVKDILSGAQPARLIDGPDAHDIARRDWDMAQGVDDRASAFERHGVIEMIQTLRSPVVTLPGGGSAWIEPTRALVAVDVNTGADTSAAAGLKANIDLARLLPAQLRCRGLGGQITIDFAPFAKAARKQVENTLRQAFRGDSVETALVGWTPLGHFELQRKRERQPLTAVPDIP